MRIEIAKTMAYHKQYLGDDDLRSGYDTVLKKVEQGVSTWDVSMGEDLHKLYDYRANVLLREKLAGGDKKPKSGDKPSDKKENDLSGDESPRFDTANSKLFVGKFKVICRQIQSYSKAMSCF